MKTIQQLLELSKNPYYKFTSEEQAVLDDFLLSRQAEDSQNSQKEKSSESSKKTRVTVRNIVKKADTYPPEVQESSQDASKSKKR